MLSPCCLLRPSVHNMRDGLLVVGMEEERREKLQESYNIDADTNYSRTNLISMGLECHYGFWKMIDRDREYLYTQKVNIAVTVVIGEGSWEFSGSSLGFAI